MPLRALALTLALLFSAAAPPASASEAGTTLPLFNGRDLSGWSSFLADPVAKTADVWSVRDGMIVCRGEPVGFLFTKQKFTSFRLVVEWRWAPGTVVTRDRVPNSGVLMRISGDLRAIPRAIEAQLRSGDAGDVYGFWGMKVTGDPARARSRSGDPALGDMSGVAKSEGAENPVGQWNRYEILLDGTRLEVSVNGRKVNEATVADVVPGAIGLQSEGGEVHFRKVELTSLDATAAGRPVALSPEVRRFVAVDARRVVLTHVRVIDGTGSAAVADRNLVIEDGRIASITPAASVAEASGQLVLDRPGYSVLPGLVGMHDHLFHIARPNLRADGTADAPLLVPQMTFSAPRLYLAAGVTTIRTTGSVEPYADLNLARAIEEGRLPGPHVDVTAPYLEGSGSPFLQMHGLRDAADAHRMVEYWADQGATSFKAYMYITRDELAAAIAAAHAHGLKVTGHLCSVSYPEAAALGIDDLEHGFFVNTQLDPGKKPDECPATMGGPTLSAMDPAGDAAKQLFATLVEHHVAVTSTLPVFEHRVPNRPPLQPRLLEAASPQAREAFLLARSRRAAVPADGPLAEFRRGMALERAFVAAGGLLIAGPDPTGNGGTVPGFSDQRELELLVEAGFTPLEAIRIASYNGALYLGRQDRIGSLAVGRNADLVLVKGDPSTKIEDVENVELVFKDGIGYDPAKLLDSVRGHYGQY